MTRSVFQVARKLWRIAAKAAVLAVLLALLLVPGCQAGGGAASSPPTPPTATRASAKAPLVLGFGFDASGSQGARARDNSFVLASAILDEAVAPNTMVYAWAFASPSRARKIWGSEVRESSDMDELHAQFRTAPPLGPGTHVTPLLQAFTREARQAALDGQDIGFLILSDGGWSDADKARPVADALAKMPNVKAIMVGLLPTSDDSRTLVESTLAAFGPRRLIPCNAGEAEAAIARFRAACKVS